VPQGFYIPMDEGPKRPKPPIRMKRVQEGRVPTQDLSSAYVSSIVDKASPRRGPAEDENEFEAQLRFELDEARVRGELVMDQKQLDSVRSQLVLLIISSFNHSLSPDVIFGMGSSDGVGLDGKEKGEILAPVPPASATSGRATTEEGTCIPATKGR